VCEIVRRNRNHPQNQLQEGGGRGGDSSKTKGRAVQEIQMKKNGIVAIAPVALRNQEERDNEVPESSHERQGENLDRFAVAGKHVTLGYKNKGLQILKARFSEGTISKGAQKKTKLSQDQ